MRGRNRGTDNRRPRYPRLPIRPIRWVNASDDAVSDCQVSYHTMDCNNPDAVELLAGDPELTFSDRNEPTLERIVGSISLAYSYTLGAAPNLGGTYPIVRLGLLVVNDSPDVTTWTPPSPWKNQDLNDEMWMWLHQTSSWNYVNQILGPVGATNGNLFGSIDIPVDVRVKRKLARDCHVMLVHQYKYNTAPVAPGFLVGVMSMLRTIVKS